MTAHTPEQGSTTSFGRSVRTRHPALIWMRATLLAGLFVLLPFGVLYLLLFQVWKLMRNKMYQLTDLLGVGADLRVGIALLLAAAILLLVALLAGVFVRGGGSTKLQLWVENNLLRLFPGYGLMRMRLAEKMGQKTPRVPGLLRTPNGLQPVLVMDRDPERALVFVPNAPQGDSGVLLVVDTSSLEPLDIGVLEFDDRLYALGRDLLHKIPPSVRP